MLSTVGIAALIVGLNILFFLLYWYWTDLMKRNRARQRDAEGQQQQQQHHQQQQHRRQQRQDHQRTQLQNLPENSPPAYEDLANPNKYPIYVISYEGLEEEPGVEPPAYEFVVWNSTTDATAVQNQ